METIVIGQRTVLRRISKRILIAVVYNTLIFIGFFLSERIRPDLLLFLYALSSAALVVSYWYLHRNALHSITWHDQIVSVVYYRYNQKIELGLDEATGQFILKYDRKKLDKGYAIPVRLFWGPKFNKEVVLFYLSSDEVRTLMGIEADL